MLLLLDLCILDVFGNYWYFVSFRDFSNFLSFVVSQESFVFELFTNVLNRDFFWNWMFLNFWLLSFRALMTLSIFLLMKTLPVFDRFEYNFFDCYSRFVFGFFPKLCAVVDVIFLFLDEECLRLEEIEEDFFIRPLFFFKV